MYGNDGILTLTLMMKTIENTREYGLYCRNIIDTQNTSKLAKRTEIKL